VSGWRWPNEHSSHAPNIVVPVTMLAIGTAFSGFALATLMYGMRRLNAEEARRQFQPVYRLLINKWWFDELYDWVFVRPTFVISRMIARFDRNWIDWFIDGLASVTKTFSFAWDRITDRSIIDGFVNLIANWTYAVGVSLRTVQTGKLRQYVMFIVIGAVAIFILISLWNTSLAA
jgi:NADH-quinone oxidoreductase subunit L